MSPRAALGAAGRDLFRNSWRLVPVNAALGVVLVAVAVLTAAVHAAVVLAVLAGPIAAALVHCSVKLVRTEVARMSGCRFTYRVGTTLYGQEFRCRFAIGSEDD